MRSAQARRRAADSGYAKPSDRLQRSAFSSLNLMPRPAASQASAHCRESLLDISGGEGGFYREIQGDFEGQALSLALSRESRYLEVGGILIETDPSYQIAGSLGTQAIQLDVTPEPIISQVGGIRVETGQVIHVTGSFGDHEVDADITEESHYADIDGLRVETGSTRTLKGEGLLLTVDRVIETEDLGGIRVETDRYHTIRGEVFGGDIDLKVDGLVAGEQMCFEGMATAEASALCAALRPFLGV